MSAINIINAFTEKRASALKEQNPTIDFTPTTFVDPAVYTGLKISTKGGILKYLIDNKDEYLKDCITEFLLSATAAKSQDIIKGYEDAKKIVSTRFGYGETDDVIFQAGHKTYTLRIWTKGSISTGEWLQQISVNNSYSLAYVFIKNIHDFYEWYKSEFGEVEI